MAGMNNSDEPNTAPQADQWYNLTLGSSFKDHNPSKFCTLRYEFKPASIDKNQRGTFHKSKDNKVAVEFQNIQPGKPKVSFEGSSEDYKENDAVLFFDGVSFRLERLHRAVKRLRHKRTLGESTTGSAAGYAGVSDPSSPPIGRGVKNTNHPSYKDTVHSLPVEVERIEIGEIKSPEPKPRREKSIEYPAPQSTSPNPSPADLNFDDLEEHLDIMSADEEDGGTTTAAAVAADLGSVAQVKEVEFDINNLPLQNDTDDEIAEIDASDDEAEKGPNAAEALRAQVNAQVKDGQTSSSSSSSGSESSGSGSGSSSSSDSESSDGDSVHSI
ncbi:hypothetical protein ABFS83_12G025300 [Erythranthe nasuta]